MPRLHVEAEGVTRAAPEAVWELVGDASSYSGWGRGARAAARARAFGGRPGTNACGRALRERCQLCDSCAPNLSDLEGDSDDNHDNGPGRLCLPGAGRRLRADLTTPGQIPGTPGRLSHGASDDDRDRDRGALPAPGWPERPTCRRLPT